MEREQQLKEQLTRRTFDENDGETRDLAKPQAVKLQRYTITPFEGDCKDWLRFWSKFSVVVNGSSTAEISKFNFLLELVKGKPEEDILGIPHSTEVYAEVKKILVDTYGKLFKVQKALINDLEQLKSMRQQYQLKEVHEFYNQSSRIIRSLDTMGKLSVAQSHVYILLDKLGPVCEIITQKDDEWEQWGLEDLMDNLKRFVERNPLTTNDHLMNVSTTMGSLKRCCWQNDITNTAALKQNVCTAIWTIIDPLNA